LQGFSGGAAELVLGAFPTRPPMPEDDIHQPHDKLFRAAFSNPEIAAAFLQAYLDTDLCGFGLRRLQ